MIARADSVYYGSAFVVAALRHGLWFSVAARHHPQVKAAVADIAEGLWTTILFTIGIFDQDEQRVVGLRRRSHRSDALTVKMGVSVSFRGRGAV